MQLQFDANVVEPQQEFNPLPANHYNVKIVSVEQKETKDKSSEYLKFDFEVIDGEHQGRHVFFNLNLWHSNPKTVEIAQQQLSAICHAVTVMNLQDTDQLLEKPLRIKVTIRSSKEYGDQNDVKGFGPCALAAAPPIGAQPTAAPQTTSQPWQGQQ